MNYRGAAFLRYRYAPMIVEGGAVKVMVYDRQDRLLAILGVTAASTGEGYLVRGKDPARGKVIQTRVLGISAFDAAQKYCAGVLL
jgi:hypothetical protein